MHRAEKFKAERYEAFSHTIDPIPPYPPRAIEWGILVRQPEFWASVVGLVTLLTAGYAAGKYLGDGAPSVSILSLLTLLNYPILKTRQPYSHTFCTRCRFPAHGRFPARGRNRVQRSNALGWNAQGFWSVRRGRLHPLRRSAGAAAISLPPTPWGH